jgi:hypothetical protein
MRVERVAGLLGLKPAPDENKKNLSLHWKLEVTSVH